MTTKKQERLEIINEQKGLSPLTGKPLENKRVETHHIKELWEGGSNFRSNKQALPISEHLAEHLLRSFDPGKDKDERVRELDIVLGRKHQLTRSEKSDFSDVVYLFSGRKIHII